MAPDDRAVTRDLLAALGITHPIIQAPIGSLTTPALAAAVSQAGGLGTLALTWVSSDEARRRIRQVRALTDRPFAVNFVLSFPIQEVLEASLQEGAPIVSTFWGDPGSVHERIREAGALHVHTVESVAAARQSVDEGVDAVVAQGSEAGGHVLGAVSMAALVPAVVDAISPVPVIAAGAIADGRGLAAAIALGARAGWLGTRFVASSEAAAHPDYQRAVAAASAEDAVYSGCFDGGWPDAPHRTLVNSTLRTWERAGRPSAPRRPGESDIVAVGARGEEHRRYSSVAPLASMTGEIESMALYAGQSAGVVDGCRPAAELVAEITAQAERILGRSLTRA